MLASGDLLLAAQRIYPATGSAGLAVAGVRDANTFDPERALRVQRVDGSLSAVTPLSAFGRLALMAPTVEQGGVLYAPLGAIQLGSTGANINRSVRLLPGSLTSVSARGATIPYGGTVDGLSYLYNGATVELGSVGQERHRQHGTRRGAYGPLVQRGSGRGDRCFRRRHAGRRGIRQRTRRFHGSHVPPAAPVRPAIGPIRTADAGRPPGLCHPARVARPVCAAGAEGCLRRLRGIPAVARRNHHHRRGRARSGGGHLYAAPRVLRAPARRFPRRGWGECAAVRACRPARRILDGDGDARAGRHGHRRRLAPSGADHAGRRVAPARAIQRDGLPGLRLGGRHAQGLPRAWSPQDVSALELRFLSDADSAGATAFRFEARCAPTEARRAMAAR